MRALCASALLLLVSGCANTPSTTPEDKAKASTAATFPTPEAAVQALVDSAEDRAKAEELLGPGGFDVLKSGDEVADRDDLDAVRAMIREKIAFEDGEGGSKVAMLGNGGWPLPLPLVRQGDRWRFDVDAGKDEILNRRIGRNELSTIETLRECVEAQLEYAEEGRDGNPPCYAAKWASSEGKHDGLFWRAAENEAPSPLGPLVAEAAAEGYRRSEDGERVPYHGYYFRILTAQGGNAAGGARSYADASGRLKSGFAFVAWPATHGNSGVMTFLVNQQGIVYQRDLGEKTAQVVEQIKSYDPDSTWSPVGS